MLMKSKDSVRSLGVIVGTKYDIGYGVSGNISFALGAIEELYGSFDPSKNNLASPDLSDIAAFTKVNRES
jgi:hypothetical protein